MQKRKQFAHSQTYGPREGYLKPIRIRMQPAALTKPVQCRRGNRPYLFRDLVFEHVVDGRKDQPVPKRPIHKTCKLFVLMKSFG